MANQTSRGQQRDKPFRDALRMAIADATGDFKRLRNIAESLVAKAEMGDIHAIKEIADRLDGKPAQALIGGDADDPAIAVQAIVRKIVDPQPGNSDSPSIPTTP